MFDANKLNRIGDRLLNQSSTQASNSEANDKSLGTRVMRDIPTNELSDICFVFLTTKDNLFTLVDVLDQLQRLFVLSRSTDESQPEWELFQT